MAFPAIPQISYWITKTFWPSSLVPTNNTNVEDINESDNSMGVHTGDTTIEQSSGFHLIEIHLPTLGKGGILFLALGVGAYLLWCYCRNRTKTAVTRSLFALAGADNEGNNNSFEMATLQRRNQRLLAPMGPPIMAQRAPSELSRAPELLRRLEEAVQRAERVNMAENNHRFEQVPDHEAAA